MKIFKIDNKVNIVIPHQKQFFYKLYPNFWPYYKISKDKYTI